MGNADEPGPRAAGGLLWCSARLTNRASLADDLSLPADADHVVVVAAAHERWGATAPARMLGAWAYAIEEERTGDVVITRDHVGIMPAYWARDSNGLLHIGDSLQALADAGGIDLTPDAEYAKAVEVRSAGLLPTLTGAIGIRTVPAGSSVRLSGDEAYVTRWWRVDDTPSVGRISVEEAADQLRALLIEVVDDAVQACLPISSGVDEMAPSGIGAHLSGGLDSTLVALVAQDSLRRRGRSLACVVSWSPDSQSVPAESIGGEPLPYDERDLVQGLADDMGVPALFGPGRVGEAPWLVELDEIVQPRRTVIRESHLLPLIAEEGVADMLSGWGGDEFASFNGRMVNRQLVRSLRLVALHAAYSDLRGRGRSPVRAVADLVDAGLPVGMSLRRRNDHPEHVVRRDREMSRVADEFPELAASYRASDDALSGARGPRDYQLALLNLGHLSRRIESWHEAGLRFGVRYHYPLLDPRIIEWVLSMPPEVFRVGGHSRRVFRLALRGLVPESVRLSTKDDPVLLGFVRQEHARSRDSEAADELDSALGDSDG